VTPWPSRCRSWSAYAAASIQERVAAGPRRVIRGAACARRRRRWWTAPQPRCARAWRDSRCTPMSPCPRMPASSSSTCAKYLLRPPLALERLTESSGGAAPLRVAPPRRDGATHLLLDPLEIIEKRCVLIPARFHLLRFHGLLAPTRQAARRLSPAPARRPTRAAGPSQPANPPARALGRKLVHSGL
jgi:Putative transposase